MSYGVIITPDAEDDLREAYRFIRSGSPQAAREWIRGARRKIKSLARHPERVPMAPESVSFHEPIRELFVGTGNRGTYRVLFTVLENTVFILHVRHGSMDVLGPE